MSIVDAAQSEKDCREIKRALEDIGCPVCDNDTIKDIPEIIRKKCHHGPQTVFNAVIENGPGIKARLINGKGYKISANDKAELTQDLNEELIAGNSIGKALFTIVNKLIPDAAKFGAESPYIVDIEFIKTSYDGVDPYVNRYFGNKGRGRRTGLRPGEWYLKIYVVSQIEPIYVCLGEVLADVYTSVLKETRNMCDQMIQRALQEYDKRHGYDLLPKKPQRPQVPCPDQKPPRPEAFTDGEILDMWNHFRKKKHHHGCDDDLDPGFGVDSDEDEIKFPENLDEDFFVDSDEDEIKFPENLDEDFFVDSDEDEDEEHKD